MVVLLIVSLNFILMHTVLSHRRVLKPFVRTSLSCSRMSTVGLGINSDGTLKKYDTPVPFTEAARAANNGDISKLSILPAANLLDVDKTGNTPLIWCADRGHTEALKLILEVVAKHDPSSVNTRGYLGNTALSRAARGGHIECVTALIEVPDINPNVANDKLQYPLHFAAYKRKTEVVRVLLASKKCDTRVVDRKGRTPAEDTSDEVIRNMIIESRSK